MERKLMLASVPTGRMCSPMQISLCEDELEVAENSTLGR